MELNIRSLPYPYQKGDLIWHTSRKKFGFITEDTISMGSSPMFHVLTINKDLTIKKITELDYTQYKGVPGYQVFVPGCWYIHNCVRIANRDEKSILAVLIKYA